MIEITICIGSSCYLKGSQDIIASLKRLIAANGLDGKVELAGSFCMGHCTEGVCVGIGEERFSVSPATTETFFREQILPRV